MNRRLTSGWIYVAAVLAFCALGDGVVAALADDGHTIVQNGRAFHPAEVTIGHGQTLSFSNQDEFIHQIYIEAGMAFDSAEQPPGQTIQVAFPAAGEFVMRCHIHPKMKLLVHVK